MKWENSNQNISGNSWGVGKLSDTIKITLLQSGHENWGKKL